MNGLLKEHIISLKPSATLAINEYSNELIARGRRVLKLGFGQSPFPVPEEVVQALRDHAHEKDYLPVKGLPALREAVANYNKKRYQIEATAKDILIGPGSKELLFIAQLCYNSDLIIPSPSWVSYAPQAKITNKVSSWIDTSSNPKKMLTASMLDKFCQKFPGRRFMLILNYPSNPTGATYNKEELKSLAAVARKEKLLIISDEIYGEMTHDGQHISIARFYPEGTIISSGLSKWCGAGGWRLGTFTFPENLHWLLEAMAVVASETFTSTSTPIQYAALKAFDFGPSLEKYVQNSRLILSAIGNYTYNKLIAMRIQMTQPEGGFYLFPDFEYYRERLSLNNIKTSTDLCTILLEETGIALLPGVDFGLPEETLVARLSYVDFDGKEALAYLQDSKDLYLADEFVKEFAPNIIIACETLKNWLNE